MRYFRIQRRFWSTIPGKLVIAFSLSLLLIGLMLLSPLWLPVVLIAHWGERRRLVKAARAFHCTKCGAQLSKASIQLADKEWIRRMQQRRKEFPGVRCRSYDCLTPSALSVVRSTALTAPLGSWRSRR